MTRDSRAKDIEIKIRKMQYANASNARATVKRAKLGKVTTARLLTLIDEVQNGSRDSAIDKLEAEHIAADAAHDEHIKNTMSIAKDVLVLHKAVKIFADKHQMPQKDVCMMLHMMSD